MFTQRIREEHAAKIKEITKDIEKKAVVKLEDASRKALEENTMLLRQVQLNTVTNDSTLIKQTIVGWVKVSVVGGKLTLVESQLATTRYQNQGLKALLQRIETKYAEATKQLAIEKSVIWAENEFI